TGLRHSATAPQRSPALLRLLFLRHRSPRPAHACGVIRRCVDRVSCATRGFLEPLQHAGGGGEPLLDLRRHRLAHPISPHLSHRAWTMTAQAHRLIMIFLLLLALLAFEVWMSLWPLSRPLRPLILVPAVIMIAILAFAFMEIREAPEAAHLFVVA